MHHERGFPIYASDDAKEKLAVYIYEYLVHVGAPKAAQSFLAEIRWDKNISLGDPPGFLFSWWSIFWELYCAAPDRRDNYISSSDAKAFHDFGFINSNSSGMPLNVRPTNQGPVQDAPSMDNLPPLFMNTDVKPPNINPSRQQPYVPFGNMGRNQQFLASHYPGNPRFCFPRPQMGNGCFNPNFTANKSGDFNRPGTSGMNSRPSMPPRGRMENQHYASNFRCPLQDLPVSISHNQCSVGVKSRSNSQYQASSVPSYCSPHKTQCDTSDNITPMVTSSTPIVQDLSYSGDQNTYSTMKYIKNQKAVNYFNNMHAPDMAVRVTESQRDIRARNIKQSPPSGGDSLRDNSSMNEFSFTDNRRLIEEDNFENSAIMKIKEAMQEEVKKYERNSEPTYVVLH